MTLTDITNFLKPDFSDLLQGIFFCLICTMFLYAVISVHMTASAKAWEKQWNHASAVNSGSVQSIEQGGVTDLAHIVATRSEKVAEVMPGMLLIVGLLGTFIGLGLALDKASSILGASGSTDAASAAERMQQMLGMLQGLGTKFKTSTWGIAGFILLKVWAEVSQFEDKRLAWVIGKIKTETEARSALQKQEEENKFRNSVKLGNAMTSKLILALQETFTQATKNSAKNHLQLIEKNDEFLTMQTNILVTQHKTTFQQTHEHIKELMFHQKELGRLLEQQTQQITQQQEKLSINHAEKLTQLNDGQIEKINLLIAEVHGMATVGAQTNQAMQSFTQDTQTVIRNMDVAADRMAGGADGVGKAANDLLGAVQQFENQFTDVLQHVRTDLGSAISQMSEKASETLEVGSRRLSESTVEISKSLGQLSTDVTATMTEVRTSIEQALDIQRRASQEIIKTSESFSEGITAITDNIGKLSKPIESGLTAISQSNRQMKVASENSIASTTALQETQKQISDLIKQLVHFGDIPASNSRIESMLAPLSQIQSLLKGIEESMSTPEDRHMKQAAATAATISAELKPVLNDLISAQKALLMAENKNPVLPT